VVFSVLGRREVAGRTAVLLEGEVELFLVGQSDDPFCVRSR
jgi:hypothetical protein